MRISNTHRNRSPVTHPKTPVGSSPRPMPAAPLPYKSSYPLLLASSFLQHLFSLYRPSRRCHGFCNAWASTLPPQSWSVMPPFRVLVLVPAGEHSARRQHRPAPRDGLPLLLHRPGQESQRSPASSIFLLAIAPLRHMPSAATCRLKSLYFYGNLMKGRRALPTARASTGQKTAPAAASTAILKL